MAEAWKNVSRPPEKIGTEKQKAPQRGGAPSAHKSLASVESPATARAEMLTTGPEDSPFNCSFCWLDPSPPFSSRLLPKYLTSWGVAPPLIISPGLPRCSSTPAEDGSRAQNVTMAAAGGPSEKARSSLCDYCHPSAARQAQATLLLEVLSSLWTEGEASGLWAGR